MALPALDYVLLCAYVCASVGVAWWAGNSTRIADTTDEFFLAGRSAHPLRVAISLISGLTSGISFLGAPGYSFAHGLDLSLQIAGSVVAIPFVVLLLIPFFARCDSASAYAYLEQRFSKPVRSIAAALFLCRVVVYLSIVLLAPALAVNAVTGIHELSVVLLCGTVSTLFTVKKGMHAVIWIDFMQSVVLVGCVLAALAVCSVSIPGGLLQQSVLNRWSQSFWKLESPMRGNAVFLLLGGLFSSLCQCGTDQIAIQRYLSADISATQSTAFLGGAMNAATGFGLTLLGSALYEFYLTASESYPICNASDQQQGTDCVDSADQILPFFFVNSTPSGMGGIMLAAVLGCTMSVFSSGLNAATTCATVDIAQNVCGYLVEPRSSPPAEQHQAALVRLSRVITASIGAVIVCLAIVATFLGRGLIQLAVAALGLTAGPVLGVFLLGMLTLRVDSSAALHAFGAGLCAMLYLSIGQACCSEESPCTGVLVLGNLNEFLLSPVLTITTIAAGLLSSACCPKHASVDPSIDLSGLTIWTSSDVAKYTRVSTAEVAPNDVQGEDSDGTDHDSI